MWEYRRQNAKDAAMEERQAVITRVPLPLLSTVLLMLTLLQCHFLRCTMSEQREAIPTHLVFSCSVPNRNLPIEKNPIKSLSTSLKPLQWKPDGKKHLLVGKRVLTHTCRQDARICSTKANLLSSSNSSPTPPFSEICLIYHIQILCYQSQMEWVRWVVIVVRVGERQEVLLGDRQD